MGRSTQNSTTVKQFLPLVLPGTFFIWTRAVWKIFETLFSCAAFNCTFNWDKILCVDSLLQVFYQSFTRKFGRRVIIGKEWERLSFFCSCCLFIGDLQIMVMNLLTGQMVQIPSLKSSDDSSPAENPCGIHAIDINPSRTMIATGGDSTNDLAVYRLPTFDPVCVGEVRCVGLLVEPLVPFFFVVGIFGVERLNSETFFG